MTQVEDPVLRRFWFPVPGAFGIGVTAYTRAEAVALAEAVATRMRRTIDPSAVLENVDIRSLDQGHVIPNMRPPNLRGVWFPAVEL